MSGVHRFLVRSGTALGSAAANTLRCLLYLSSTPLLNCLVLPALLVCLVCPPLLVGLAGFLGWVERRRLVLVDGKVTPDPHLAPSAPGLISWFRSRLRERATWREVGQVALFAVVFPFVDVIGLFVVGCAVAVVAAPVLVPRGVRFEVGAWRPVSQAQSELFGALIGLPLLVAACLLCVLIARSQARLSRALLSPSRAETAARLAAVTGSRARIVAAFEAQQHRLERDLHDGAQQHLVLLSMALGLAEFELAGQDTPARQLVADAHAQARLASESLRALIQGVRPRVLTDFGLAAALEELAQRCTVPMSVDLKPAERLPAAIENAAYFVAAEAVTNAVRHAAAGRIRVTGALAGGGLVLTIEDDGRGGASFGSGTGLSGLVDRAAVVAGTLTLTSPVGGPTRVRLEVPCPCA